MNQVFLIGRLGMEPEVSYTQNGNCVCKFSIATNETYRDKSGEYKQKETDWHLVECWNGLAEKCKNLKKGEEVFMEGTLKSQQWKTQNGETRRKIFISARIVRKTDFICNQEESLSSNQQQENALNINVGSIYTTNDIPF